MALYEVYTIFQLKLTPVSGLLSQGGVINAIATETWHLFNVDLTQVCMLLLIISHFSLRNTGVTDTGAISLARALKHNKSLEELK